MNRKENKSSLSLIIIIVIGLILLGKINHDFFITSLFGFAKKALLFSVVGILALIALIVMAIIFTNKIKKNKVKKNDDAKQDFLTLLSKKTFENNQISIDEDTYLKLTDLDTIIPETIDIYMNDEYIGSLAEFQKAYPNSSNNLQKKLIKQLTKKKKDTKKVEEPIQPKELNKDCAYYIAVFQNLNSAIEVEEVKEQIIETIGYLREIKQIEDEFGESKNKTRKLYEYYLPMYADILANYDRLHDNAPLSQEFKDNEVKLLKTADLINTALKNVSASLVENYHTNLNVDMKTLEAILKKDGLVNDLEVNKHD